RKNRFAAKPRPRSSAWIKRAGNNSPKQITQPATKGRPMTQPDQHPTYEFGVITDEIDQDFERACRVAADLGMNYVEIHQVWNKQGHELTDAELDQAKAILDHHGLRTHLICGMFFRPFSLGDVDLA